MNFVLTLDDGSDDRFFCTLKEACTALSDARMNGKVTDLTLGKVVFGRGSGWFGIGTAMSLGLPLDYREAC